MSLAQQILTLRNQTLKELEDADTYFNDSSFLWKLFEQSVEDGQQFSLTNSRTGMTRTQIELNAVSHKYVTTQVIESAFMQCLSIFESFIHDFIRLWLNAYPRSLMKKQVEFKSVLNATDKSEIIDEIVRKEVADIIYKRPADWFVAIEALVKLGCPKPGEIEQFSEAKAARDVMIHNRSLANNFYVSKSGKAARFKEGERVTVTHAYFQQTWTLMCKIVADVSAAAAAKV